MYHHLYGVTAPAGTAAVHIVCSLMKKTTTTNIKMDWIDGIFHISRCEF